MVDISKEQVLAYRLRANHLTDPRLDHTCLATAAISGLQDGSPRSGLLSLAARVENITPDDWQADELAQVFGPRGAIYIVRRKDIPVFTMGLLPRDAGRVTVFADVAARVHELLDGRPMRQADVVAGLPDIGGTRGLRWAATLGTLLPVWDAVDTIVHPAPAPAMDPEAARLELARRFFTYLGPADIADLQWWLAGLRTDAVATVAALGDDLTRVSVEGKECLVSTPMLPALEAASHPDPNEVHLLPPDDVYINRLNRSLLISDATRQKLLFPQAPPPGALVIGGAVAGTWRRRAGSVVVEPWSEITPDHRGRAEEIATRWPLHRDGRDIRVEWLDPR